MRIGRRARLIAVALLAVAILPMAVGEGLCAWRADGRLHQSVDAIDPGRPALVLGCSPTLSDGRPNLFFQRRIDAALDLWEAGRVSAILVSGDNGRPDYDEPSAMRRALIEGGVPADRIVTDHAGFRTLDSVVRARQVFGCERLVIVSQASHARRALVLSWVHGLDADAYAAEPVHGMSGLRVRARESLARVRMILDIVLRRKPRFLGPHVPMPPASSSRGRFDSMLRVRPNVDARIYASADARRSR